MTDLPSPVLNLSCYKFVALHEPQSLRGRLMGNASACRLKGTIVLAQEGINLFVAGPEAGVREFMAYLRTDPRFAGISTKESWSRVLPFQRLKVAVKREIIRMNQPAIQPEQARAPSVTPATLAHWLSQGHDDAGRPLALLDTRNAFEVEAGTFAGAIDWRLTKFSDFPAAVQAHRDELQGKTVVSFCTGGIRCEKAALVLQQAGLAQVYQLEGGILKYFEETDGAPHWQGGCFVFDEREVLGATLAPMPRSQEAEQAQPGGGP